MIETKKMDIESFSVGPLDSIFYIPSFLTPSEQAYLQHQVNGAPASKWKTLKNRRLQNWVKTHQKTPFQLDGLVGSLSSTRTQLAMDNAAKYQEIKILEGGVVHEKGLIAQSLPPWLTTLTKRISTETGLFPSPINHVLVNEYEPGQGIMPHQDGPLYFPVVAIVSLGSPTVMRFVPHQSIVEPREGIPPTCTGQVGGPADDLPDTLDVANSATDEGAQKEYKSAVQEDHEKPGNLPIQKYSQRTGPKDVSIILMPGSLLIFKDFAYQEYLHGIDDSVEHKVDATVVNSQTVMDGGFGWNGSLKEQGMLHGADLPDSYTLQRTGTRISLTCRLVPKVKGKFLRL